MLTPVAKMKGEDEEDSQLLNEMAIKAHDYISSYHWCLPIRETYFAFGVGGIIALFLFEFDGKIDGLEDKLWVIVGDLPSVYLDLLPDDFPHQALETYCMLMEEWIAAVRNNGDFNEVYPVPAPRTAENADTLESRLGFLRKYIIPDAPTDIVNASDGTENES